MNALEENERGIKHYFLRVITVQMICVSIICIGTFALKYISPKKYKKVSKFYRETLCENTDIKEITKYFDDAI